MSDFLERFKAFPGHIKAIAVLVALVKNNFSDKLA